jgi:hypothetical protein
LRSALNRENGYELLELALGQRLGQHRLERLIKDPAKAGFFIAFRADDRHLISSCDVQTDGTRTRRGGRFIRVAHRSAPSGCAIPLVLSYSNDRPA